MIIMKKHIAVAILIVIAIVIAVIGIKNTRAGRHSRMAEQTLICRLSNSVC